MRIANTDNIPFEKLLPTEALLKSALRIHKYEDAKLLSNSMGITIPGKRSFYNHALDIAENVISKNKVIREFVEKFKDKLPQEKYFAVRNAVEKYGKNIDVVV